MSVYGFQWMDPQGNVDPTRRQQDIDEDGSGAVMGAVAAFHEMRRERMGAPRTVEAPQDKAHREQEERCLAQIRGIPWLRYE